MADRIPEETLTEIRTRTSISELVSSYVSLRKVGRNHVGLCPFHAEKTPSFSVNEDGGFFHCFGCGVGGNAFTFVSRIEGISFPEAARRLADQAGVAVPKTDDPQARARAHFYHLNELAVEFFERCLRGEPGAEARSYLSERGISRETVARFRLGFAPSWGRALAGFLVSQHADLEAATTLGLTGKGDGPHYYDKFRDRLMFPITDVAGRCVGFGGRVLAAGAAAASRSAPDRHIPKYLNSPDSLLYKKGALLYGLSQAKEAIKETGRVLVVEGYTDLLTMVQRGYPETVAVLGTALTVQQLHAMRRFTSKVFLFYDGDDAGRRAALRSFPLCIEAQVEGGGIFLPEDHDPDSYARAAGQARLDALVAAAQPLEDFYFAQFQPAADATAGERAQAARHALEVVQKVSDMFARGALVTKIAQRFGVAEEELRLMVVPRSGSGRSGSAAADREAREDTRFVAETELIQLMLVDRQAAAYVCEQGLIADFRKWGVLAQEVVCGWQTGQLDLGAYLDRLPREMSDRVSRLYTGNEADGPDRARLLRDCAHRLRGVQQRRDREQLQAAIREAEQNGDEVALKARLRELQAWNAAYGG